jgi:hypothetical protein
MMTKNRNDFTNLTQAKEALLLQWLYAKLLKQDVRY